MSPRPFTRPGLRRSKRTLTGSGMLTVSRRRRGSAIHVAGEPFEALDDEIRGSANDDEMGAARDLLKLSFREFLDAWLGLDFSFVMHG
jgi:hypothetical protein